MAKCKNPRTPADKEKQKKRSHANQVRKYNKLIAENPNNPHRKEWDKLAEFYNKN